MKTEEFNQKLSNIEDLELIKKSKEVVNKLCKTGGKSFTMSVPVKLEDSDVILSELIKRFEKNNIL